MAAEDSPSPARAPARRRCEEELSLSKLRRTLQLLAADDRRPRSPPWPRPRPHRRGRGTRTPPCTNAGGLCVQGEAGIDPRPARRVLRQPRLLRRVRPGRRLRCPRAREPVRGRSGSRCSGGTAPPGWSAAAPTGPNRVHRRQPVGPDRAGAGLQLRRSRPRAAPAGTARWPTPTSQDSGGTWRGGSIWSWKRVRVVALGVHGGRPPGRPPWTCDAAHANVIDHGGGS